MADRARKPMTCTREGCGQTTASSGGRKPYCCAVCRYVDVELVRTQRVCEAVGTSASSQWARVVALSDALTEYQRGDRLLREAAESVGITDEQWFAIKGGIPPGD